MKRDLSKELNDLIINYDYSSYKMSFWEESGNFIILISVLTFCLILMACLAIFTKDVNTIYKKNGKA